MKFTGTYIPINHIYLDCEICFRKYLLLFVDSSKDDFELKTEATLSQVDLSKDDFELKTEATFSKVEFQFMAAIFLKVEFQSKAQMDLMVIRSVNLSNQIITFTHRSIN